MWKWWKRFNPTRIDQKTNPSWIKEILGLSNILNDTVNKQLYEAKEKNSIRKGSNEFSYELDRTPKEIDIKD